MKAMPLVRFIGPIFLLAFFLSSCADDGSGVSNSVTVEESSSSAESSNSKDLDKSSSSIKNEGSSSSTKTDESSSSKKTDESSSSDKPVESSSSMAKSSSSEIRSSSVKLAESSSSEMSSSSIKPEESSSSEKSSSSVAESSSSVESSSSEVPSSSSAVESSSSVVESSSSLEIESSSSIALSSSSETPTVKSIYDAENNTLTDLRDNKVYKTVTIGEQIWMAENLNYMPEDTVGTIYSGGTVCGGGAQNSKEDSEKCDIFGRLYLRKVALNKTTASNRQGICPDGWSIPKKEDWEKLISHLGENVVLKIKGDSWESTPGTNESGFSAIPAGNYNNSVIGYDNLSRAYFFYWNSKSDPYFLRIRDEENDLYYSYGATYMMYSVRCIKD